MQRPPRLLRAHARQQVEQHALDAPDLPRRAEVDDSQTKTVNRESKSSVGGYQLLSLTDD
jgi:hypothetical protein